MTFMTQNGALPIKFSSPHQLVLNAHVSTTKLAVITTNNQFITQVKRDRTKKKYVWFTENTHIV